MTNKGDSLGDRMKAYEAVPKLFLMKRTPVIMRLDGKAFHTFTKKLLDTKTTPYSNVMHECMAFAMYQLVKRIQGCVLGYTQSDEITLLLRDYDTLETQAWYDYNIEKMVSVSATIAANAFNYKFKTFQPQHYLEDYAEFDSRVHNIPREEVANNFIWRQQDASRNSVQMLGHYHFSQSSMHGLNNPAVQDKLMLEKGINWNDQPIWAKRGSCAGRETERSTVLIDEQIPIFTADRQYIERHVYPEKL